MMCFNEYTHSIPIIYSSLENQYQSKMIKVDEETIMLFTQFDFHFISGQVLQDPKKVIECIQSYVRRNNKSEFILFTPNNRWQPLMKQVFNEMNGFLDKRSIYCIDIARFNKIYKQHTFKYDIEVVYEKENASRIEYPVAIIKDNQKICSYTKGFMIGKNHMELDVYTDEDWRRKGLAFETSLCLIDYAIKEGYTPNWTCWSKKHSSRMLAEKLGFQHKEDIDAYIWLKDIN